MPNPTSSPSAQSILAKIAAVPAASWTDDRCRSAILESTLAAWHSHQTGAPTHEHKPPPAERLPIPKISRAEQCPFIRLVDEILATKRAAADTRELEWRLDELVYALYGLTEAEFTAIERSLGLIHATDAAEDAALGRTMSEALVEPRGRVSREDILKILRNP